MTVADYGIEKETGKKLSEHALSMATSKDCKFNLKDMTICKEESLSNNKIVKVAKANQNLSKKTKVASLTN
ncbi:MAG: hypothetical protein EBR80_01200 [Proteobacteria bacterium]|uniref:Uncharacterized protein n=1 Tax=Candidatus Fonsibacter lacus TaxID=2576439 RepID=A0A845S8P5_9PROT|nr:hypothetical protein [Candidatus Fonsibacter lacus]NBV39800.1 hypothetical protein [Candidatus Fonsibacter lacus]NCU53190.1 hypothetical protein [Candidatus Fonsibacter lacus]NCU62892.1 hypothetical protein [Candidatus Fonsibacter lacus]